MPGCFESHPKSRVQEEKPPPAIVRRRGFVFLAWRKSAFTNEELMNKQDVTAMPERSRARLLSHNRRICTNCGIRFVAPPHHQICRQCWFYRMARRTSLITAAFLREVER